MTRNSAKMVDPTIGVMFNMNSNRYITSGHPQAVLSLDQRIAGHVTTAAGSRSSGRAVTVLNVPGLASVGSAWLEKEVHHMVRLDDVFRRDFLAEILFDTGPVKNTVSLESDAVAVLKSWGTHSHAFINLQEKLPRGPYWLCESKLYQVYRLFPDPLLAFMFGVLPSDKGHSSFRQVQSDLIPVPSRLYSESPTTEQPLRGKRFGVKDIYHVNGLVTSASCRAYAEQYGIRSVTAPSVQKLLDLGAVLVGKTRTVQFASGEMPPDWIDYQCPFNPRGDGYFNPSGSSTGSAAGVTGYDWLDYAIGTDTLGSIVYPATEHALFGIRPTHGTINGDDIVKVSVPLDTPGFLSRNIVDFQRFGDAWYWNGSAKVEPETRPKKILYLNDWFNPFPSTKREILDRFVTDLERTFDISRTDMDLNAAWRSAKIVKGDETIEEYQNSVRPYVQHGESILTTGTTIPNIQMYDCWHNNQGFRDDYEKDHGHQPYVNPMIRFKWGIGQNLTNEDYKEACKRKNNFRDFMQDHIFADKATLMIIPAGDPDVIWRDDYMGTPREAGMRMQGYNFPSVIFGVLGGSPLLTFPVGQIEIDSKVRGGKVNQPLSLLLIGPAGSDAFLASVVRRVLEHSGRPLGVQTGPNAF